MRERKSGVPVHPRFGRDLGEEALAEIGQSYNVSGQAVARLR